MNEWKHQRFVAVESAISQDLGMKEDGVIVVMTDLPYWILHVDECIEWCEGHGCKVKGMTIEIPDAETMTLFALRWAG